MRILHLSDPQFGKFHRFPAPGTEGDLAQRLLESLAGEAVDVVALTGDVAEWSKPAEYAQATLFLDRLRDGLGLERNRLVFVPGNHDVSFSAYDRYVSESAEFDRTPVPPFWPKWQHFKAFLDAWYGTDGAHFVPSQPWSWWELPELDLVVAGFNSTLPETKDEHGWAIGEVQARWFAERLCATRARYRLALVHHDLFEGAEAARRERERLSELPLTLLLHGHTHIQTTERLGDTPALGVGSLGIEKEWREEDVANQYQLLHVHEGRCERVLRRYHGPKSRFLPDDVLSKRDRELKLETAETAERDRAPMERFADRVAEVLRLREEGAEVVVLGDEAIQVRRGFHRRLIGVAAVVDDGAIGRYVGRLADYRAEDPTLPAEIVHRGATRTQEHVTLRSLVEVQGLVDFEALRRWQRERIAEDRRYPEALYVPQRIRVGTPHAGPADEAESALERVHRLVTQPGEEPCLALVLAPFGTGKTFLIRQLARQLEREWTDGGRVPLWIELRHLEKASSFESLLAAHLSRAGQKRIDHDQLDYMRREGRVVLLFDGFDELVLRVSYDRATEHLETLAAAADGRARIVVTSRTEHFLRTRDAEGALLRRIRDVAGLKVLHIQEFSPDEAARYLGLRMGDAGAARFERLRNIPNLLDLARTPRMLEMLAELDDADLDAAERRMGPMTAARLYDSMIERWLRKEEERRSLPGSLPPLGWVAARTAATRLAERAWVRSTEEIEPEDLRSVASALGAPGYGVDEAAQELGSGTLLVRDEEARFRFAHRSVLEFLVAETCASALNAGEPAPLLDCGEASGVLIRFLGELAGDALDEWAREGVKRAAPEGRRRNALAVAAARKLRVALDLSGQDLRGRDDVRELDLRGADLSGADLRGLDLSGVDLSGARLDGTRLDDARLVGANLDGCIGTPSTKRASFFLARGWDPGGALRPFVDCGGPVTKLAWFEDGGLAAITGGTIRVYGPDLRQRVLLNHPGVATVVVATQDGRLLATGGVDGVIRVWDCATGEMTRELRGHTHSILAACFLGPTETLVSLDDGGDLGRWDVEVREVVWLRCGTTRPQDIASLRWGQSLAIATPRGIRLVSLDGRELEQWLGAATPYAAAVPFGDGRGVFGARASGRSDSWSDSDGVWVSSPGPAICYRPTVAAAEPGTAVIACRTSPNEVVLLWDGDSHREVGVIAHRNVQSVAYSLDGQRLALGGATDGIKVMDLEPLRDGHWLSGRVGGLTTLAMTTGTDRLFTGGLGGSLVEWNLDTSRVADRGNAIRGTIRSIAVAPDGTCVVVGTDRGYVEVQELPRTALPPRGLRGGSGIVGLHLRTGGEMYVIRAGGRVESGRPDGSVVKRASASGFGTVVASSIAPDGSWLALAGHTIVNGFELNTGSVKHRFVYRGVGRFRSVCISPTNDTIAVGTADGVVLEWSKSSNDFRTYHPGHRGTVRAVTFSPTTSILASAGDDGCIVLTDPTTSTIVHTMTGHHGAIRALVFSPDGLDLYSAGDDGRILRWDVASGQLMGWMAAGPRGSVCVTADGRYRIDGDVQGWFWHAHGMHRYDPGELDRWLPELRVPDDQPFPWSRPG